MSDRYISLIYRTFLRTNAPGKRGIGSDGSEGVLHFLQSSNITGSPMSYPGHSLVVIVTLRRDATGGFHSPSRIDYIMFFFEES